MTKKMKLAELVVRWRREATPGDLQELRGYFSQQQMLHRCANQLEEILKVEGESG
jgi:hypothetical protein